MRKIINLQQNLFTLSIFDFEINLDSRDEIPKLLIGLQYILKTPDLRDEVFKVLKEIIPPEIDKNTGCPGMDLWKILVLGTLRLNCNWDYDKVAEIANEHHTVRLMLGHDEGDFQKRYPVQTVIDNVSLLTQDILDRINQIYCKYGHKFVGQEAEELRGSCDSFVVETDVDFPTDINLLFKAMVKVITIIARICDVLDITDWRQFKFNLKTIKRLFNKIRRMKHSSSKNPEKKAEREQLIIEAYQSYLELAESFLVKVGITINKINEMNPDILIQVQLMNLNRFMVHARRQLDQIERRVIDGEKIPHDEKLFSIFEEHTEWICKGKAGVRQELGLGVCILKDQFGFILHHHVMENEKDDEIAILMVVQAKKKYSTLKECSFDRGFYTPCNKKELKKILEHTVLPKKGKLSAIDKEEEHSEEFIKARHKHSAVESSINALENHGLDRCRDHGIDGFKRYVSLAVLARNIQLLGHMIQQKELNKQRRRKAA